MKGCAAAIAFIGKTKLVKHDCKSHLVQRYENGPFSSGTWSSPYGTQKASGLAGDEHGHLWIHDKLNVMSWESNRWQVNELPGQKKPKYIAAGMDEHVYVISTNDEILRFTTFDWTIVP